MKSSKLILALWLFCTIAVAQTLPQKQPVNSPVVAKPNAARTATPRSANGRPVNVPASQVAAPGKPSAAAPGLRVETSPTNFAAKPTNSSRAKSRRRGTKAVNPTSAATTLASGVTRAPYKTRRDPFVSPVVEHIRNTVACSGSGRQCLVVGEISFHGVVSSPSGFIAVVMNGERTYFLRENDPLADGSVERITKDTIVLRERSSDALGRPLTREVTKRIGAPPV